MASASKSLPFTIPKYIRRSKTAILKALSSTVGMDPTAPHYQYIDDPAMIPTSIGDKRNNLLAKEFGRRAARQLAVEWPTLFMFDRDKPRLEAFRPDKLPSLVQAEKVDENSLRSLIEAKNISGAIIVFERLRAMDAKFSPKIIQDLFVLSAYFNARDPPPSENEEWPAMRTFAHDSQSDTTQSADIINLLYTMVEKNPSNCSAMICWLCKYGGADDKKRSQELVKEALKNGWILEENAYIGLINKSDTIEEANAYLKAMAKSKLKPSIRTFNAAIACAEKTNEFRTKWKAVQGYLAEAASLNLEPNLTTYHHVLTILWPENFKEDTDRLKIGVNCLSEILSALEAKTQIRWEQFTDQLFFVSAIKMANAARNMDLMDRVEQLYRSNQNSVKMTAFTIESNFYGRYIQKKVAMLNDLNEIGKLYMSLVPRCISATKELILLMMGKLEGRKDWRLTKRVIEDAMCARYILDMEILDQFLKLLDKYQKVNEKATAIENNEYETLVVKIVDFLLEFSAFNPEFDPRLHRKIHPHVLAGFIALLLRTTQKAKAWSLFEMLISPRDYSSQLESSGHPSVHTLEEIFHSAIQDENLLNSTNCLEVIRRYHPSHNVSRLVDIITSTFHLEDQKLLLGELKP